MKNRTISILLLSFCLLVNYTLFAQKNMKAILLNDIVKVENGKYSVQESGLLVTFDKEFQVRISASAPVALLSRDNFLRFYGAFSTSIFSTYLQQEGLQVPNDLHMLLSDKPVSQVDLEVTISMNERGVEYTLVTKNMTSKMDLQWLSQLYLDN